MKFHWASPWLRRCSRATKPGVGAMPGVLNATASPAMAGKLMSARVAVGVLPGGRFGSAEAATRASRPSSRNPPLGAEDQELCIARQGWSAEDAQQVFSMTLGPAAAGLFLSEPV